MKFLLFLCLFQLSIFVSVAQTQYTNVKIEGEGLPIGPCEPSICINPQNPNQIVAGAVLNRVYASADGGKTWEIQTLTSDYGVYGDPCIVADTEGNFYYFHLSDVEGKGWASEKLLDRIVAQRSEDGGKTWTKGSYMGLAHPKDQDKEWAVVDSKTGNIYVTWTQFDLYDSKEATDSTHILFSYSEDKGDTWSNPVRINQFGGNCLDGDGTVEGAVPAVGPDGEIYVSWSLNGKIYFDKSLDGGKTWLKRDKIAALQPGGWDIHIPGIGRANGMPITLCDLSDGPHRGTIYINFADQRNGEDDTDIWLVKSTDGGETWSAPKRVNNDAPGKHQFFTWMALDPTNGNLHAVFYDRRHHSGNATDVYLATSTDGGQNFMNEKISETPFTPSEGIFFGDYNNISAYGGTVRPIWTRADGRILSVWTALIDEKK